ncbi:MAG: hypothetical protein RL685_5523 [Pseudomonadota bacterium]|jgi:hypothetical protein
MSTLASTEARQTCVRVPCCLQPEPLSSGAGADAHAFLSVREEYALDAFSPVSPELLARRDLLQRTDTKYLLSRHSLPELLGYLERDYRLLYAGDQASALYLTQYLDTPEIDFFHDHRRGKRLRFKVRVRHYPERSLSYLEIKGKSPSGGTRKWRRSLAYLCDELSPDDLRFVSTQVPFDAANLVPSLVNQFRRITLVGIDLPERITLDMDLQFRNDQSSQTLGEVLIVEVKQPRFCRQSPASLALARCRALAGSTSKYCVGTMLLRPEVRHNRLRPMLARLERVCQC